MTMISKAAVGIAVGIAGIFVGYCVYFDQKRRSAPDFKKKLRERRKAKKQLQKANSKIPDLKDHQGAQRFFLEQIELGEQLLERGDVEGGIEHLASAVAICGDPTQLLQILQKTLPPGAFHRLLQQLPTIGQKIINQSVMADEDIE